MPAPDTTHTSQKIVNNRLQADIEDKYSPFQPNISFQQTPFLFSSTVLHFLLGCGCNRGLTLTSLLTEKKTQKMSERLQYLHRLQDCQCAAELPPAPRL